MMIRRITRRYVLKSTAAMGAGLWLGTSSVKAEGPNEKLNVALIGIGGLPRRPSWSAALAVVGLAVMCCFLASSQTIAQPTKKARVVVTPIDQLAKKLQSLDQPAPGGRWKLKKADSQPSVMADGYKGYRVVLRRTWREPINPPQRALPAKVRKALPPEAFRTYHEDWEFVLVPVVPKRAPVNLKSRIKWRKSNSPYYTRDICLGEGHGYMWFTRGTLFNQEFVRGKFKLDGGDNRLRLAVDGLSVEGHGMTANQCQYVLAKFGDRALPHIKILIDKSRGKSPNIVWTAVTTLRDIRTPRATAMVIRLMKSRTKIVRQAAEYVLVCKPFRKEAKQSYLDMLRRRERIEFVTNACIEFKWTEAISIIRKLEAKPRGVREYGVLVRARRTLEGKPIGKDLLKAERTFLRLDGYRRPLPTNSSIAAARLLLIKSKDAEAANIVALSLAVFQNKANTAIVNKTGIEILRSRPRKETLKFLKSLDYSMHQGLRPPRPIGGTMASDVWDRRLENVIKAVIASKGKGPLK